MINNKIVQKRITNTKIYFKKNNKKKIKNYVLKDYFPTLHDNLPAIIGVKTIASAFNTERELLYNVLFDMTGALNALTKLPL